MEQPPTADRQRIQKQIDFSKVDTSDRPNVKTVLQGILTLNDPVPNVDVDIAATDESYNIMVKGWTQFVEGPKVQEKFMPPTREPIYDSVITWGWFPADDPKTKEGIFLMRVRRSNFGKSKKNRK
jgi:hypothetical protein